MAVDPELREILNVPFLLLRKTGQDAWQQPTYTPEAEGVPMMGAWQDQTHEVRDADGVKRTAQGTVWLDDVYGVGTEDMVTHDGASIGDLIAVETFHDPDTGAPYAQVVHYG